MTHATTHATAPRIAIIGGGLGGCVCQGKTRPFDTLKVGHVNMR